MCEIKIKVSCPHCHSSKVVKNGKKSTGRQNFLCRGCGKQFQHEYYYLGADPQIKTYTQSSLLHGSGIRDCQKIYGIAPKTVLRLIEQTGKQLVIRPRQKHYERVLIDELYSFVHNKGKKVWIFYAYAPETGEILAVTMGKRSIQQLRYLMLKIKHLRISVAFYCTDGFAGFQAVLPWLQHLIGKAFTKPIEGVNTAIRSKLARLHRRTTKFAKKLKYQWYLFLIFVFYFNELPSYI
jgi:IS1 family transposase/transposase-like protein